MSNEKKVVEANFNAVSQWFESEANREKVISGYGVEKTSYCVENGKLHCIMECSELFDYVTQNARTYIKNAVGRLYRPSMAKNGGVGIDEGKKYRFYLAKRSIHLVQI